MRFIICFLSVFFIFSSANAMYQGGFLADTLGVSSHEQNKYLSSVSYSKYINESTFDESLIDQLITSFSLDNSQDVLDESLIDQIITSFPDTLDSYSSKTPFNISLYQMLIDTFRS